MRVSICMSTQNKAEYLNRTLESIRRQQVDFPYEIVICDDGSNDNTKEICDVWKVEKYIFIENDKYRNPAKARNAAYKNASGKIIIAQSDEVVHVEKNTIEILCNRLHPNEFIIATVYNWDADKNQRKQLYTGLKWMRPLFFLGSLWRKDLYAIGGNDEEFTGLGYDDNWFGDCLEHGLKLKATFRTDVKGYHQDHYRPPNLKELVQDSKRIYERKVQLAKTGKIKWEASGGPWEYEE